MEKLPLKNYTIQNVLEAEFNLEPIKCCHCGKVGEVVFMQYIGDAQCGYCGNWQLDHIKKTPSKEEIKEYMTLHNTDEAGIDNQWDMENAEYYLLLDDKYYYLNKGA